MCDLFYFNMRKWSKISLLIHTHAHKLSNSDQIARKICKMSCRKVAFNIFFSRLFYRSTQNRIYDGWYESCSTVCIYVAIMADKEEKSPLLFTFIRLGGVYILYYMNTLTFSVLVSFVTRKSNIQPIWKC